MLVSVPPYLGILEGLSFSFAKLVIEPGQGHGQGRGVRPREQKISGEQEQRRSVRMAHDSVVEMKAIWISDHLDTKTK